MVNVINKLSKNAIHTFNGLNMPFQCKRILFQVKKKKKKTVLGRKC